MFDRSAVDEFRRTPASRTPPGGAIKGANDHMLVQIIEPSSATRRPMGLGARAPSSIRSLPGSSGRAQRQSELVLTSSDADRQYIRCVVLRDH